MLATRVLLAAACALAACSSSRAADAPKGEPERAFYFWRSTFTLSAVERAALTDQKIDHLYVRAFDIGWNTQEQRAEVLGPLEVVDTPPAGVVVTPVVFIRQTVFRHLPAADIPALAQRTWKDISARMTKLGPINEVQLDCDWTERSRDGFFAFAKALRAASGVPLSSTIRLHQIKYRERTGVPPVERGVLMLYNMGEMAAGDDVRSIFDAETTKKYLSRIADYPLPLDVALPIFSWTLHTRDGSIVDLLQSTDPDELPALDFVRGENILGRDPRFVVTQTAFLHGTLLREGDVLEVERTTPADTLAAAELVRAQLHPTSIVLFDLSDRNLTRYSNDQLAKIYSSLR